MRDEVTRVQAVTYLQGVFGHGVFSTLFLGLTAVFAVLDQWGVATVTVVVAYGVAVNGVSLYVWDEVRARVQARVEAADAGPDRDLTAHRLSAETKADLLGGFVLVGAFVAVAVVASAAYQSVGLGGRTAVVAATVALAVGNVAAFCWWLRT